MNKVPERSPEKTVETLAGYGLRDNDIADYMDVSESTLKNKYARDLKRGRAFANIPVINTAYRMAVAGKPYQATFFWLKCRAGWRETDKADDSQQQVEDEKIRVYLPANGREALELKAQPKLTDLGDKVG